MTSTFAVPRYKPSTEPGILLPAVDGMTAPREGADVLLDLRGMGGGVGTSDQYRGGGIYVSGDGFVWAYAYAFPDAGLQNATPCDIGKLREGSKERYDCLHSESKLLAKLERTLLHALRSDLTRVDASERIEFGVGGADLGGVVLEVPGRGREGSPLVIASCGNEPAWQLTSPEATRIIDVFRRVRRALGRAYGLIGRCPDFLESRLEVTRGVVAWWSLED